MREHTKNLVKIGKRNFKFSERFQWMKIAKRTYEVYWELKYKTSFASEKLS